MLSCVQLFETQCAVACQAPLPMAFSWQEYWGRLPFPPPGDLPNPGIEPRWILYHLSHQGSPDIFYFLTESYPYKTLSCFSLLGFKVTYV